MLLAKKVAPPPHGLIMVDKFRGLIMVDKCSRAGGVGQLLDVACSQFCARLHSCAVARCVHSFVPAQCSANGSIHLPWSSPPPHPLSSNSSPHISSRRSGPTRHHIFHWEFSTPTNVQFPPKEVLDITALLEHCLQVSGIWKHIEEVKKISPSKMCVWLKICSSLVRAQWVFTSCVSNLFGVKCAFTRVFHKGHPNLSADYVSWKPNQMAV